MLGFLLIFLTVPQQECSSPSSIMILALTSRPPLMEMIAIASSLSPRTTSLRSLHLMVQPTPGKPVSYFRIRYLLRRWQRFQLLVRGSLSLRSGFIAKRKQTRSRSGERTTERGSRRSSHRSLSPRPPRYDCPTNRRSWQEVAAVGIMVDFFLKK